MDHCNRKLKVFDRDESIGSRFCFFYETFAFRGRHKAAQQHLDVSAAALKLFDLLLVLRCLEIPGFSPLNQLRT